MSAVGSSFGIRVAAPCVAGTALLLHATRYDYLSDDAFIFARYARNFVEGHGLVFNVGERVEGFTSVLWVLLLAGLGSVGLDYVWAMRAGGALCTLGCIWLVNELAIRSAGGSSRGAVVALVMTAAAAPLACWSLAGLETPAFALAILASLAVFRLAPAPRAVAFEALALSTLVLLRPEGILLVPIFTAIRLAHLGVRGALHAAPTFLAPIVTLGALTLARFAYYDDWLPNTARAKDAGGGQLEFGLWYAQSFFADYGTLALWVLVFGTGLVARRQPLLQAAALIGLTLSAATIWVGGDGLGMYRFFVPILPLFALLLGHAVDRSLSLLEQLRYVWAARAASTLLVAVCSVAWASPDREHPQFQVYDIQQRIEVPRWTEVGRWIAAHTPDDASVACVPIGAIGYYSRRVIRDMVGLTDRHIARLRSDPQISFVGHRKHDGPYILSLKPTILLTGNVRVLKQPLALTGPDFGRPRSPAIRMRERDLFGPQLSQNYEPRIAMLPSGRYLHYFVRRDPTKP
jgi:hypothetical protein